MGMNITMLKQHQTNDGQFRSMMGTSQNYNKWQIYFDNPKKGRLGLMNAGYQIGSVISFPFVYFSRPLAS